MAVENSVMVIGRLGADPEMRATQGGTAVANFRVAVNEKFGSGDEAKEVTTWLPIVAWRKLAEVVSQYCHKGSYVAVQGRLRNRSWEDKDKVTRYITEIVAESVKFLDPKGDGTGSSNGNGRAPEPPPVTDDDIPF